jgi:hypothetical protein
MPVSVGGMEASLHALVGAQAGVFSTAEASARDVEPSSLRRALARRELVRLRRGAYVDGPTWHDGDDEQRFRLACLALARSRPGDVLSHQAALAVRGLPVWPRRGCRIDLLTDVGQAVQRRGVHLHPRDEQRPDVVDGVLVAPVAWSVVRTALTCGRDAAVVGADAALHRGLVTTDGLWAEVARVSAHEGRGRSARAMGLVEPKTESVGETLTRLILVDAGLVPRAQVELQDRHGTVVARVDLLVEGVVVEFDGRVKYRGDPADRDVDPAAVVWAEKRREDAIRRLGFPVERVIWSELDRPALIAERVKAARRLVRAG